jgi:hypothetical protein
VLRPRIHACDGIPSGRASAIATGTPVCATVTHLDGLVLARSAFESSICMMSRAVEARTIFAPREPSVQRCDDDVVLSEAEARPHRYSQSLRGGRPSPGSGRRHAFLGGTFGFVQKRDCSSFDKLRMTLGVSLVVAHCVARSSYEPRAAVTSRAQQLRAARSSYEPRAAVTSRAQRLRDEEEFAGGLAGF